VNQEISIVTDSSVDLPAAETARLPPPLGLVGIIQHARAVKIRSINVLAFSAR
jgi:hypothetical protein